MPTIQTIIFEDIDIDVQTNKQLCIHPIHRCLVATPFPIKFNFAVLSSAYDLPPGTYVCKHVLISEDKKKEITSLVHKPATLDKAGGYTLEATSDFTGYTQSAVFSNLFHIKQ